MKVVTTPVLTERAVFERPSTLLRNRGSFMSPGERVATRRCRPRSAACPTTSRRTGCASPGGCEPGEPAHRARHGQPLLGVSSPRPRRHSRGLWHAGRAAVSPGFSTGWPSSSVQKGWSQKAFLREIVTSATYRQSSTVTPALRERIRQPPVGARGPLPGRGRDSAGRGARRSNKTLNGAGSRKKAYCSRRGPARPE